jgi:hypothetical protein
MTLLDTFIGLVLIYFLYSLLTSIIAEMLSTWMGLRARHLRQGIENLLNDKPKSLDQADFFTWIMDIFLVESKLFKFSKAGKFYDMPEIKTLAKKAKNLLYTIRNTKPSYLSACSYSKTLVAMWTEKGQGITLWEQVKFAVGNNTLHFDPETDKKFKSLLKNANGSYALFIQSIEDEFNEMMDRVNGWYKRKISLIVFWLGFIICLCFNVDSIQLIKLISKNEDVRNELVTIAEKTVANEKKYAAMMKNPVDSLKAEQTINQSYDSIKTDINATARLLGLGWAFTADLGTEEIENANDTNQVLRAMATQDTLQKINSALDTLTLISAYKVKSIQARELQKKLDLQLDSLMKITKQRPLQLIKMTPEAEEISKLSFTHEPNICSKICQVYGQLSNKPLILLGIFITALALSLGAQFWFDLLKKLISLRGSGNKPEDSAPSKTEAIPTHLQNFGNTLLTSDPMALTISKEREKWENLPGFLGFNQAYDPILKKNYIEVIVDGKFMLPQNYPKNNIEVRFQTSSKGVLGCVFDGTNYAEGSIKQDITNAIGTVAGIVKNSRTGKKALLTCGHVVRTQNSGFFEKNKTGVSVCNGNKWVKVGHVTNAIMSCFADGGVVDLDDPNIQAISKFNPITNIRKINNVDVQNDTFIINKSNNVKTACQIYYLDRYFTFQDSQKDVKYFELLMLNDKNNPQFELSSKGDSGSLITDNQNNAVGILVGGSTNPITNDCFSYAIKISDLFEILQIEPLKI